MYTDLSRCFYTVDAVDTVDTVYIKHLNDAVFVLWNFQVERIEKPANW